MVAGARRVKVIVAMTMKMELMTMKMVIMTMKIVIIVMMTLIMTKGPTTVITAQDARVNDKEEIE